MGHDLDIPASDLPNKGRFDLSAVIEPLSIRALSWLVVLWGIQAGHSDNVALHLKPVSVGNEGGP